MSLDSLQVVCISCSHFVLKSLLVPHLPITCVQPLPLIARSHARMGARTRIWNCRLRFKNQCSSRIVAIFTFQWHDCYVVGKRNPLRSIFACVSELRVAQLGNTFGLISQSYLQESVGWLETVVKCKCTHFANRSAVL